LNMPEMFQHQSDALNFLINHNGCGALYLSMGTGKTRIGIEFLKSARQFDPAVKMLVICPLTLIEAAWGEDIQRFSDFKMQSLRKRYKEIYGDILVMNYEMVRKDNFDDLMFAFSQNFPMICYADESSRMKNYRSQTTQAILRNIGNFKYRIVASGTPAPNNEMEYFAQMHFVKPNIFGRNFYSFRATFFHLKRGEQFVEYQRGISIQDMFRQGWKYALKDSRKPLFEQTINDVSHHRKLESCVDLPKTIEKSYLLEMAPEQKKVYIEMRDEMVTEIKGREISVNMALTKLGKLRQICSGFMYDDENSLDLPNPKLKELGNILDELGKEQVIIWFNYRAEKYQISRLLSMINYSVLDGTITDKDKEIAAFKNGENQYLLAHPASAGHGLTFRNNYQIFYSLSYSYEQYAQAKARTHRIGSTKSTVYIYLIVKNSIEEVILKVLKAKGSKQDMLKEIMA